MTQVSQPIPQRFAHMDAGYAPGQERTKTASEFVHVDFGHGDVSAFPPHHSVTQAVEEAIREGVRWAYSPYRGHESVRTAVSQRLSSWTETSIDPRRQIIVTPGTQGGLFLALSALVERGDRVAIVAPDYFANRKIIRYLEAEPVEVPLDLHGQGTPIDLDALEQAFASGVRLLVFSNPNNPTGKVYSAIELDAISALAATYGAHVVVDSLYARQIFDGREYVHLRSRGAAHSNVTTLFGPSKTESVSGFRVGVVVGPDWLIGRMESLQGIVSLRAAGYTQAALNSWLREPDEWLEERVRAHQEIRDALFAVFDRGNVPILRTEGGSYLFADISKARLESSVFVRKLRERKAVTVTRGTEFGDFPHHVRLNFSQDKAAAIDAIDRLVQFVKEAS